MGTRCPKNVNSFKLVCTIARLRWHSFAENLLQGRLSQEPWVYGDPITGVHNIWGHVFCWTQYCSKILHFPRKHSLHPSAVRALLYGCGGGEG